MTSSELYSGQGRKGFRSSSNLANTHDASGGRLQATKASLKRLNIFKRNKAGRHSLGDQGSTTATETSRHISISQPFPLPETAMGSLQSGGDYMEDILSDDSASNTGIEALPQPPRPPPKDAQYMRWETPPLFKAYSRAIKYATLPSPCLSAETILRNNQILQRSRAGSTIDLSAVENDAYEVDQTTGRKTRRRSYRPSEALNKSGWTRKIYVLDAEGHILQYAIEGAYDRMPEKTMLLGKQTVAFASDAIPGKHWVIQISEAMEDPETGTGTATADAKKHFFGRLGADHKKDMPKSILMVLNSPEEMQSWLSAVRQEIEHFGGKEYVPDDVIQPKRTSATPSREGVESLFDRTTSSSGIRESSISPNRALSNRSKRSSRKIDETLHSNMNMKRQSVPSRHSEESQAPETDDADRIPDLSRFSFASVGSRTVSSHDSSPCPTPGAGADEQERGNPRFSAVEKAFHRLSSQTLPEEATAVEEMRANASSPPPAPAPAVNRSPPNFSVPVFSKRYSAGHSNPVSRSSSNGSMSSSRMRDHQQRLSPTPEEPPRRPTRARAATTSDTQPLPQASIQQSSKPKRFSSTEGGRYGMSNNSASGNPSFDYNVIPASSSQSHRYYGKGQPPHIPETLDEDPFVGNAEEDMQWPLPGDFKRASWDAPSESTSGYDLRSVLDGYISPSSDGRKRASWASGRNARDSMLSPNEYLTSGYPVRPQRASWGSPSRSTTFASPSSSRSGSKRGSWNTPITSPEAPTPATSQHQSLSSQCSGNGRPPNRNASLKPSKSKSMQYLLTAHH
ncbi:hypothetical protein KEM55_004507, partial [Ascosphaera atra]